LIVNAFLTQLREVKPVDLLDVALVTIFFYSALALIRRTQARFVAIGLFFLGALYIVARGLDLRLTIWLLQGFFAIFVVIVVVIFQEELRQLFERFALWGLRRRRPMPAADEPREIIVRCAADFARLRVGALIVVTGRQPIARQLHGGVALEGVLSEPLLKSLFEPHSPAHDGAVIVEGAALTRFSAQLPLSTDFRQLRGLGTRHAAALGLAERSDALCVVVSEERGQISVAEQSTLRALADAAELERVLGTYLRRTFPRRAERPMLWALIRENWVEKIVALGMVMALWYLFVPGSRPATLAYSIPVKVVNVPPGYAVDKVEPAQVTAVFSGLRRAFYLFDASRIDVTVDATLARSGRRTFTIAENQIRHPPDITVQDVRPEQVRISLRPSGPVPPGAVEAPVQPPLQPVE